MNDKKNETERQFLDYLKKSGLIYFYDSLESIFLLIHSDTKKILYANNPALKIFKKGIGSPFCKNFSLFEQKLVTSVLEDIANNKRENAVFEFVSPDSDENVFLRFQKVTIGSNRLIVVFSSAKDPEVLKRTKDKVSLESNYLDALYHISKIIGNLHKNEAETFTEIANTIAKLFKSGTIWVRLKIRNKSYVSDNFTDANRIYSRKINTADKPVSYMEIGLTKKNRQSKGLHFTVEEEKVFDEIIERIEDALLEKNLRDKLLQNEKRFRSVVENASDAILVTDESGKIIDANKKSASIFGSSVKELIGEKINSFLPDFSLHENFPLFDFFSSEQNGKVSSPFEKTIVRKNDGEKIHCEITVASWELDDKTYLSFFIRDVTLRKKNEAYILYRSRFEQILAQISAQFIESGFEGMESSIEYALKTFAVFLKAVRACIYILDTETKKINCRYEWTKPNVPRLIGYSQNLDINQFAEILNLLTQNSVIAVSRKNSPKSFKPYLKLRKVQSVLGLAFYQHDKFAGFIGFEFKDTDYELKKDDVPLLTLFSKILGGEIQQFNYELERREIENQMRKMHEAIKQSANAIVITDTEGNIEYVNPKFEELTEYKAEEVLGKNPRILKSGYTTEEEYKKLWETIKSGKEWRGVFKNKTKSGKFFWENAIISPIKDESGKITNFLAVKENITEQILMKNQLDLARKMEAIGQLAAGIAHEINTPMQFISDNTVFLKDSFNVLIEYLYKIRERLFDLFSKEQSEQIEKLIEKTRAEFDIDYILEEIPQAINQTLEGVQRVTKIIRTMRDFSHPSSGEKAPADINKAIRDTVLITRNSWKYVAELKTELCDDPPLVNCAIDQINQALLNIIVNAAQAIEEKIGKTPREKGLITIATECTDDSLVIKISDNGIGIPQENIEKIFEPFFTTKEVGKGTGQGLALVHDIIVNKHGGSIVVESEKGKGTAFIINLPLNN